jgi:hypothetical protein
MNMSQDAEESRVRLSRSGLHALDVCKQNRMVPIHASAERAVVRTITAVHRGGLAVLAVMQPLLLIEDIISLRRKHQLTIIHHLQGNAPTKENNPG